MPVRVQVVVPVVVPVQVAMPVYISFVFFNFELVSSLGHVMERDKTYYRTSNDIQVNQIA